MKPCSLSVGLLVCLWWQSIGTAHAGYCSTAAVNPLTDVSWNCMLPIKLGSSDSGVSSTVCSCVQTGGNVLAGVKMSYWEPKRVIDTVSEPWCFLSLGGVTASPNAIPGKGGGDLKIEEEGDTHAFQQMHYYVYPVLQMLNLFTDLPCLEQNVEFDIAMLSEPLPTWDNDIMAMLLNPEALLFGNPIAALACLADSASLLTRDKPLDYLFWCMGSWGNAYPLTGNTIVQDYVEANAAIAARGIYLMGRTGLLKDHAVDACGFVVTPIWRKSHYRLQMMSPVRDSQCRDIGEPGVLWSALKNPPHKGNNFAWMVFMKIDCCAGY